MNIFSDNPFRPAADLPLYQELYAHLRAAILSGQLKNGLKMPSTRAMGAELNISRNTVLSAYRQMLAEGYLETRQGSGTFVAHVTPELLMTAPQPVIATSARPRRQESPQPLFSELAKAQMELSPISTAGKPLRPFMSDATALDDFPFALWSRLVARQARCMPVSHFMYQDSGGFRPLREAISAHVTITRQVHCTPEQVLIVPGSQGALNLCARMLINADDPVWMEDPGYIGARGAFAGSGARIIPVPIDHEGLVVDIGIARAPQARLVYLTPSHQFPLGVTMSLGRRLALLDWAKRSNAYILEDDYDSEFRFATRPLATLQGLDEAERVIYIGTFSKVLFPSIRIGYMILPPALIDPFLKVRRFVDIHPPLLEQAVLVDFMNEGHFVRHLRRMRTLYAERRSALLEAARDLPLELHSPEAGIHCVGWLPAGLDDRELAARAGAYDLDLIPVSNYSIEPLTRKGLMLGYGGFRVQEIKDGVRRLGSLLRSK